MNNWTVETVLNRALLIEKESYDFYLLATEKTTYPGAEELLNELAEEELKHQNMISDALEKRELISGIGSDTEEIEDLQVIDWLEATTLSEDATFQDILIFAGKREKETYEFYLDLLKQSRGKSISNLFSKLAQEELKHKNRIEKEYEKYILKEM